MSRTIYPAATGLVMDHIVQERIRQDNKWGEQNHSPLEWLSILLEEVGEVAKEVNALHFDGDSDEIRRKYRTELIQVAAVAAAAVEADMRRFVE